jgi:pantoate--beta-alanine ligase
MDYSNEDNDYTVASVFVNPIQFGPNEDLSKYPRDFERDCQILEAHGVDVVFHPEPEEMYFPDFCTYADVDVVSDTLGGATRENHFRGVCTVIAKFLNIVQPDKIYFGKKDAQQLAVVRRMVRDLNFDVDVVGCPTVREADGLAMSSRNVYLNPEERKAAQILSRTLRLGQDMIRNGCSDSKELLEAMNANLATEPMAKVEYVEVVDGLSMQPIETFGKGDVVAMAVRIGSTRLIDNITVGDMAINV